MPELLASPSLIALLGSLRGCLTSNCLADGSQGRREMPYQAKMEVVHF